MQIERCRQQIWEQRYLFLIHVSPLNYWNQNTNITRSYLSMVKMINYVVFFFFPLEIELYKQNNMGFFELA